MLLKLNYELRYQFQIQIKQQVKTESTIFKFKNQYHDFWVNGDICYDISVKTLFKVNVAMHDFKENILINSIND